ncbi:Arm DNA-binding domain-containing protein [Bacillus thuringiensis]
MVVYKDEQRGTFFFVTRIRQFDRTKKQVKRRGFKTREEALEAEAKMLAEKDLTSNLTFAQVADKYFEWYCQGKKQSKIVLSQNVIYNYLVPEFGKMNASTITARQVMIYLKKSTNDHPPEFSQEIHTTISAIFNFVL